MGKEDSQSRPANNDADDDGAGNLETFNSSREHGRSGASASTSPPDATSSTSTSSLRSRRPSGRLVEKLNAANAAASAARDGGAEKEEEHGADASSRPTSTTSDGAPTSAAAAITTNRSEAAVPKASHSRAWEGPSTHVGAEANAEEHANPTAIIAQDELGLGPGAYHVIPLTNLGRSTNEQDDDGDGDDEQVRLPQAAHGASEQGDILVTATLVEDDEEQQQHQQHQPVYNAEEVDDAALKVNRMVSVIRGRKFQRGCCAAMIAIAIIVGGAMIGVSVAKSKCQARDKTKLGDGTCDGGEYNTAQCGFDGGDCEQYNALVEQGCPVPNNSDASRLGDGICDGGIFVAEGCDLDGGDCQPVEWALVGNPIVGESENDESGAAIAFSSDGTILAIGAARNPGGTSLLDKEESSSHGHVRVHSYDGTTWTQLGGDIDGGAAGDSFGVAIAASSDGKRIIVGANRQTSNQTGYATAYEYNDNIGSWTQLGNTLTRAAESGPDVFGSAVAMNTDGTRIALGAPLANGNGSMRGTCHTYQYDAAARRWQDIGVIDGEVDMAFSAGSLSMSGDGARIAIGAPFDNAGGNQRGTTRIYNYDEINGGWTKVGDSISGEDADGSGWSVSLSADGSILAVGSPSQDKVRAYTYDETVELWRNIAADILGEASGDEFGGAVSLSSDGMRLAVGARKNRIGRGQVRVFQHDEVSGTWLQIATDIDGTFLSDALGWSVSLSADGKRVAAGAPSDGSDDSELAINGSVRVYEEP